MDGRIIVREVVWYNHDVFEQVEKILRQKALMVYKQMFPGESDEAALIRCGEASFSLDLIEKLAMKPEEIYRHDGIEAILVERKVDLGTFSKAMNYYSRRNLLNKPLSDQSDAGKSIKLKHNIMMLIEGEGKNVGQLVGYFYSPTCSQINISSVGKDHCLTDWCKNYKKCPRKIYLGEKK